MELNPRACVRYDEVAPALRQQPGAWPNLTRRSDVAKVTQRKFVANNQWTTRGMSVERRFWTKVGRDGDCWVWLAGKTPEGYGLFWLNKRYVGAHRVAYTLSVGPIPDGLELDHLCRNPSCVRPDHLEPVTTLVNQQRGRGTFADVHGKKTHCLRGHPFDDENTYWFVNGRGFRGRQCKACCQLRQRERREAGRR